MFSRGCQEAGHFFTLGGQVGKGILGVSGGKGQKVCDLYNLR